MQGYSIENITIEDYFTMSDSSEYDIFINTIKAKNSFNGKPCDISKLTFDEVEVIKKTFHKGSANDIIEMIIELYCKGSFEQSKKDEFFSSSVFDLFRVRAFLQEWITEIIERENKVLSSIPDEKLIMINASERLKAVSHLLTKMRLGEQFSCSPDEVGKWKYTTVFMIMVANKRSDDVQRDYAKQK